MTITKVLFCLVFLFCTTPVLAELPSDVDILAVRLSDYLQEHKIAVARDFTKIVLEQNGFSTIHLVVTGPGPNLISVYVFPTIEGAERELTDMENAFKESALKSIPFVSARNANLVFSTLTLMLTEKQIETAEAIKTIFMKFPAHSPQGVGTTQRNGKPAGLDTADKPSIEIALPQMVVISGKGYEIGKYEVTQKEWVQIMGSNPSGHQGCENCPVENVSWNSIQKFFSKLNEITNKNYRLPTASEWFFACNGGANLLYCGGNDLAAVGWIEDAPRAQPVGRKKPNMFGIYDMTGNVAEWVQDCCQSNCNSRAIRGSGWVNLGAPMASAERQDCISPHISWDYVGFRLARSLQD